MSKGLEEGLSMIHLEQRIHAGEWRVMGWGASGGAKASRGRQELGHELVGGSYRLLAEAVAAWVTAGNGDRTADVCPPHFPATCSQQSLAPCSQWAAGLSVASA